MRKLLVLALLTLGFACEAPPAGDENPPAAQNELSESSWVPLCKRNPHSWTKYWVHPSQVAKNVAGGASHPDCTGTCGGSAKRDCAGVCKGKAKVDCAGVCAGTSQLDCAGTCNGGAKVDCAGTCNGNATVDCAGTCNGTAKVDCAGTCNGSATVDCAGMCNGTAERDCAGICKGTAKRDCAGVCGGDMRVDCAGVCGGRLTDCPDGGVPGGEPPVTCKCFGQPLPTCTPTGTIRYVIKRAADPTPAEQAAYAAISCAMNGAISYYNCNTDLGGTISVSYNPGVPTAQSSYNGGIAFGESKSYMVCGTAMHEMAHHYGIGTYWKWKSLVGSGNLWTGAEGNQAMKDATNNPNASVHISGVHFWPYGLNYASEIQSTADFVHHTKIVTGMRHDMGLK